MKRKSLLIVLLVSAASSLFAQTKGFCFRSTDGDYWKMSDVAIAGEVTGTPQIIIRSDQPRQTFLGFGTTFNELDWDAYSLMSASDQALLNKRAYNPSGDLRLTVGRISIGANDFARDWYSCNETDNDFTMQHFTIERDQQAIIPSIKVALEQNPGMTFWASPWSPPQWMKTNKHYAQQVSNTNGCPFSVAPYFNDQFIDDPNYYNAYCLYFSKFIDAYAAEGIPITSLAYQNEAYSYTVYPGCSWTAATTGKFLANYLGSYFAEHHPDVKLILGTMNTASVDVFEQILNTENIGKYVSRIGFQWEGGGAINEIMWRHPEYEAVMTESECGGGTFDWSAAAHTFQLINHYLGNGVTTYTYWNLMLQDGGYSTWGWKQNALVQVNSSDGQPNYTAEYYALKHYSHLIPPQSKILTVDEDNLVLAAQTPDGAIIIVAGNEGSSTKTLSMDVDGKYLLATLPAKSFTSYVVGDEETLLKVLQSEAADLTEVEGRTNAGLASSEFQTLRDAVEQELNGSAATGEILNPTFTDGSSHWTIENVANGGDFRTNTIASRTCWNNWSNNFTSMNIYQDVQGLQPGAYTLSVRSMCGPGEISDQHAYAVAQCDTAVSPVKAIAEWATENGWELQTTSTIIVGTDGLLRVGYASTSGGGTAGWFCATDFALSAVDDDSLLIRAAAEKYAGTTIESNMTRAELLQTLTELRAQKQADAVDLTEVLAEYDKKAAEAQAVAKNTLYADSARETITALLAEQAELLPSIKNETSVNDLIRQLDNAITAAKLTQAASETTDFTFYIQNPGAETEQGWALSVTNGDATRKTSQHYSGDASNPYFDSYCGTSVKLWYTGRQTLTGLPNGTYRLVAAARADGNGAYLTAETAAQRYQTPVANSGNTGGEIWSNAASGTAEKQANNGNGYGWADYQITDISVTDGVLTIGFTNDPYLTGSEWTGTWMSFDDFRLYYIAAPTADAISTLLGEAGSEVISTEYFTPSGIRAQSLQRGINIVRKRHADGTVTTAKVLR